MKVYAYEEAITYPVISKLAREFIQFKLKGGKIK